LAAIVGTVSTSIAPVKPVVRGASCCEVSPTTTWRWRRISAVPSGVGSRESG